MLKIQRQEGKHCRSRWDGSLWAVSSGSAVFANSAIVVFGALRVKVQIRLQGYCRLISTFAGRMWSNRSSLDADHNWSLKQLNMKFWSFLRCIKCMRCQPWRLVLLTHLWRMDFPISIILMNLILFLGTSGVIFHFYLISNENHVSQQNSPRWDAAFCGVTSGAILFACVA